MNSGAICRRAIYPGSFDPMTNGHVDLARRARNLFEEVVIAVAAGSSKNTLFSMPERIDLVRSSTAEIPGVTVVGFSGLLIDLAARLESNVVIRGLRAVSDFEYEFQLAWMNRQLDRNIETLFFAPAEANAFVSATLVKEIAQLGGDVSQFLHPSVVEALTGKIRENQDG